MTTYENNIIDRYRPGKRKMGGGGLSGMYGLSSETPNKKKGLLDRYLDEHRRMVRSLHYLSGFMTLMRHTKSKRRAQFMHEGTKLLTEAEELCEQIMRDKPVTFGEVKRMRLKSEAILRFVEKVEADARRESHP
jgi:hypothetical protein